MFIQVVCQNPTHTGRTRAKRRFDNGTKYRMEVIDRAEDFFVDEAKQFGDMTKINLEGRKALGEDPVFSVLEDGAVGDPMLQGMVESLKAQLATASSEISNLKVENEKLTRALEISTSGADKLRADLAVAESMLAEQGNAPDADLKHDDHKHKGGHKK